MCQLGSHLSSKLAKFISCNKANILLLFMCVMKIQTLITHVTMQCICVCFNKLRSQPNDSLDILTILIIYKSYQACMFSTFYNVCSFKQSYQVSHHTNEICDFKEFSSALLLTLSWED